MKWISSTKDLERYLNTQTRNACTQASMAVEEKILEFIAKYYAEYKPMKYHRTQTFLNSIIREEPEKYGNGWSAIVYIDPTLDYSEAHEDDDFGMSEEDWLVTDTAAVANAGYHGRPTIPSQMHFFDDAYDEILDNKHLAAEFIQFLKDSGITVTYERL